IEQTVVPLDFSLSLYQPMDRPVNICRTAVGLVDLLPAFQKHGVFVHAAAADCQLRRQPGFGLDRGVIA
ncbi:MAG: hypothetical protein QF363_19345, partial [Planctomycetaceae bacterium]|nr:hypothetical protein [Planctomycetaceae bacterium]